MEKLLEPMAEDTGANLGGYEVVATSHKHHAAEIYRRIT